MLNMRYRIVGHIQDNVKRHQEHDKDRIKWATDMKEIYGLYKWPVEEVIDVYGTYSEDFYYAAWINPDKEHVEKAFGIILEEIKNEQSK